MPEKWCVINLGDAGRSPRINNHVVQLAASKDCEVDYVTHVETDLPLAIKKENVHIHATNHVLLKLIGFLPAAFYFWLRFAVEIMTLEVLFMLHLRKKYDGVLVQNPYSLPVLVLLAIYKLWSPHTKVVIDMHNFGYTLMGKGRAVAEAESPSLSATVLRAIALLRSLQRRIFVQLYFVVETTFVRLVADEVLVVSQAMKVVLEQEWNIPADRVKLLYDTPNAGAGFKKLSLAEKHNFLSSFAELRDAQGGSLLASVEGGKPVEKKDRPLVFTVSTSWGIDDDFDTLIQAIELYKAAPGAKRRLEFFFTGTGPKKHFVAKQLKALSDELVQIHMKWFSAEDYAKMIACADFGISVHASTSGVDLPIKVIDSLACHVPVIAYNYAPAIKELVSEANGHLYDNAAELCELLLKVGKAGPTNYRFEERLWADEWKKVFKASK